MTSPACACAIALSSSGPFLTLRVAADAWQASKLTRPAAKRPAAERRPICINVATVDLPLANRVAMLVQIACAMVNGQRRASQVQRGRQFARQPFLAVKHLYSLIVATYVALVTDQAVGRSVPDMQHAGRRFQND